MSIFEIIFWIVVVYLGASLLKFLISIAVACYLLKNEAHKEDK